MKLTTAMVFLAMSTALSHLQASEEKFAVVLIDSETERQYGEFPLDRQILARGIDKLADLHAKGLVLKFFLDLPKNPETDASLAKAIGRLPTLLQARIDDTEPTPNPFPDRFLLKTLRSDLVEAFSGQSGWLPLSIFSAKARNIGFVDVPEANQTSMVEKYQDRVVPSLALCSLELAFDSRARIIPGKSIELAGKSITLDQKNSVPIRFPATNSLSYLKFHDLLAGKATSHQIEGKVVILGYDGAKIPKIDSPFGQIGAHRYFIYNLEDLANRFEQPKNAGAVGVRPETDGASLPAPR